MSESRMQYLEKRLAQIDEVEFATGVKPISETDYEHLVAEYTRLKSKLNDKHRQRRTNGNT